MVVVVVVLVVVVVVAVVDVVVVGFLKVESTLPSAFSVVYIFFLSIQFTVIGFSYPIIT